MCGVCGVVTFDGRAVDPELLRRMTNTLVHRGPDGEGYYFSPPMGACRVGFGHRRLKIIDLSDEGAQPISNEDGTLWIVFNGEIYNFRELRARLISRGHRFQSQTDTEVILHLYEESGTACLNELDGMFAFGLWDERQQQLFLARDRMGKKPLFYYQGGSLFTFASELKALLVHPDVNPELSSAALSLYFYHGYVPAPHTLHRDIAQLPPAHAMLVTAQGGLRIWRYWQPPFVEAHEATARARSVSETEVAERLRQLLTEAVAKRLIADVPLGAFLSGGVDSTIVVGLMSRLLGARVKTFSIGFAGDPAFDETAYARVAAQTFRTDHTEFRMEPRAIELLERLIWYHDGPFADSSALPTYLLAQLTRQHVTVALNGDGGDELFAGYARFAAAILAERLPRSVSHAGRHLLSVLPEPRSRSHWMTLARRFFQYAPQPLAVRLGGWAGVFGDDLARVLLPDALHEFRQEDLPYPRALADRAATFTPLAGLLFLNLETYLPGDLLVKADRCTMGSSLEARSPFLDDHLVEYAVQLPDSLKINGRTMKYILKRAFADLLPEPLRHRRKMGFGVPLAAWFRGPLRSYLLETLMTPSAEYRRYLNAPYVQRLVECHLGGTRDYAHRLWAIVAFERWLRILARPRASQPVLSKR